MGNRLMRKENISWAWHGPAEVVISSLSKEEFFTFLICAMNDNSSVWPRQARSRRLKRDWLLAEIQSMVGLLRHTLLNQQEEELIFFKLHQTNKLLNLLNQ